LQIDCKGFVWLSATKRRNRAQLKGGIHGLAHVQALTLVHCSETNQSCVRSMHKKWEGFVLLAASYPDKLFKLYIRIFCTYLWYSPVHLTTGKNRQI